MLSGSRSSVCCVNWAATLAPSGVKTPHWMPDLLKTDLAPALAVVRRYVAASLKRMVPPAMGRTLPPCLSKGTSQLARSHSRASSGSTPSRMAPTTFAKYAAHWLSFSSKRISSPVHPKISAAEPFAMRSPATLSFFFEIGCQIGARSGGGSGVSEADGWSFLSFSITSSVGPRLPAVLTSPVPVIDRTSCSVFPPHSG